MKTIERLLRLSADFQNFCSDSCEASNTASDSEELSAEDLDCVAAAALPMLNWEDRKTP